MRCLVTGGLGFIGSHITERLLKEGNFVRILDNLSTSKISDFKSFDSSQLEIINGDILDTDICAQACQDIDVIFHNAAIASIRSSVENPVKTIQINANGTLNMLQAAVTNSVRRFIFSSSAKIYGSSKIFPQSETHSPNLLTPYALSKFVAENYCKFFSDRYGIETISLRHFSVYGPRQSLKDGFIGMAIESIANNKEPLLYTQPHFLRDFTYIDDAVEANILATQLKKVKFDVFNTGTGTNCTIYNMVSYVNKICGKNQAPKFLPLFEDTISKTLCDTSKAYNILNYKSEVNLYDGLAKTIDWYMGTQQLSPAKIASAMAE
ncbi:MAG: SDR family NAD(P)-dependent oxidoreductase [Candidatus Omnitrophota bacterium]|nr:SDR family NAD(P)-dependent oxidoreductase [Candidatus Omnitrophota bacterium]